MMIEDALYSLLSTNPSIVASLGARQPGDTGVYPITIPEDPTLPAISYQIISSVDSPALNDPIGVTKTRLQVECWGATYADAVRLRNVVTQALVGFRGVVGTDSIQNILRVSTGDVFADVPRQYTAKLDIYVWSN